MEDEDDAELVVGLENLYVWLPTREFRETPLADTRSEINEVVNALDATERSANGLKGISAITKSAIRF